MTRAAAFSERRWAWRSELHADRLRFSALALRLAVQALRAANYDPATPTWPQPSTAGHSNIRRVMEVLHFPVKRGDGVTEEVAIAIGVTRAVLIYETAACVGILDPMLLVEGACDSGKDPLLEARRATTAKFLARHMRVFFDESAHCDFRDGERQDERVPLMMSAEAIGPAVAEASQKFLSTDAGPAVLQAALPALANVARDIAAGFYDERAWRNVGKVWEESEKESQARAGTAGASATTQTSGVAAAVAKGCPDEEACVRAMSGLRVVTDGL